MLLSIRPSKPTTDPLNTTNRLIDTSTDQHQPSITELLAELDAKITRLETQYGMTRQEATP